MPRFATLDSIKKEAVPNDGQPGETYYAGGTDDRGGGSGTLVVGPDGRGRKVGESKDGTVLTRYRNGFFMGESEFKAFSDPENVKFMERIEAGHVPEELRSLTRYDPSDRRRVLDVSVVDKSKEDWDVEAAAKRAAEAAPKDPFGGEGRTLSAPSTGAPVAAPTPSAGPIVLADGEPVVQIGVRLHTGKTAVVKLNPSHTVGHLHSFVQEAAPTDRSYSLIAGFPPKPLALDPSTSIADAKLAGERVTQKLQ